MKKIIDGVYLISGQDGLIPDAHIYLIGLPSSKDLTLIDVGVTGKGQEKLDVLKKYGIQPGDIKRIILTHAHLDHIGCIREVLKETHAELWMHLKEADLLEQGQELIVFGQEMVKEMCHNHYNIKSGDYTLTFDKKLEGNEDLEIGGMIWKVLHVPGHSLGSLALYDPANKILIAGDVVYADYTIGRFDFFGSSAQELKSTLQFLSSLDVNILLPGHNQIMMDVPRGYLLETAKRWEPFLKG